MVTAKNAPARVSKPTRYRVAKKDASIESIQTTLEKKFGLPAGSIKLIYPSGRKARSDSTVGALRAHWERSAA